MKLNHKKVIYSTITVLLGLLLLTIKFSFRKSQIDNKIDTIKSYNIARDKYDIENYLKYKESFVVNFGRISAADNLDEKYVGKVIYYKGYRNNKHTRNKKFWDLRYSKNLYIDSIPLGYSNIEYFNLNSIHPNFIKDYYIDFIKDYSLGTLIVNFEEEIVEMEFYNQLDLENTFEFIRKLKNDDIAYLLLWALILATILVGIIKYSD